MNGRETILVGSCILSKFMLEIYLQNDKKKKINHKW